MGRYEAQLDDLHAAADERDAARIALADAREEGVRLMEEVRALRGALRQRDDEMRQMGARHAEIVLQLAGAGADAPPHPHAGGARRGSVRSW